MKPLVIIPALIVVLLAASCRTVPPTDPLTMKPSTRCMPGNMGVSGDK